MPAPFSSTPISTPTSRGTALTACCLVILLGLLGGTGPAHAQGVTPSERPASPTSADQSLTTTPPLDTGQAPAGGARPDFDMERITGPRHEDGKVTSTTFWPLGFAAVGILVVFGSIFYRAARGNRRPEPHQP